MFASGGPLRVTANPYYPIVHETPDDLRRLQRMLDRSFASVGDHLGSIFSAGSRLDAADLVARLDDGIVEMHLAAVTTDGAPLVAPLDAIFFQGRVWFGLPAGSVRSRLVRQDPRVSASYTDGSFAFIVHGTAVEVTADDPGWPAYEKLLRDLYVAQYGPGWIDWYEQRRAQDNDEAFGGYIEPRVFFAKS